jgi:hypothetical protein
VFELTGLRRRRRSGTLRRRVLWHGRGGSVNQIARWDGASWSALGSGTNGGSVFALSVFDDGGGPALYAGGQFYRGRGRQCEPHRQVGRLQLVRSGIGNEHLRRVRPDRLRRRRRPGFIRRGRIHYRRGQQYEQHRQVGRRELVRSGIGNEPRRAGADRPRRRWRTGTPPRRAPSSKAVAAFRHVRPLDRTMSHAGCHV